MTEDFSNTPPSITELRAEKTGEPTAWTPRDALINLLRQIDSGKIDGDVIRLVICYQTRDAEGYVNHHYNAAGSDRLTHIGLLFYCAHMMADTRDE